MRKLSPYLLVPLIIIAALAGLYLLVTNYPRIVYGRWIKGSHPSKYFTIEGHKPLYLKSEALEEIPEYEEQFALLWKNFPIGNLTVPLPTRHPLFTPSPLIELTDVKSAPKLGIAIRNSLKVEAIRLYALPMSYFKDHSHDQELFKLPFVRNIILKFPQEQVWRDLFSKAIDGSSTTLEAMIYDLYLIHLRSKFFPPQATSYGLINDGKDAVIQLQSDRSNLLFELVLTHHQGSIYSFILRTNLDQPEGPELRSKFLRSISFNPADASMGALLYTEFKALSFSRQVDREGMLYLFSAWSQDPSSMELFRDLIFYLERGRKNSEQLQPLYAYALKKFGKTFTTRSIFNEHEDPEVTLQRKIEIENIERRQAAELEKAQVEAPRELNAEERMNLYLKQAKEAKQTESDEMVIH